MTETTDTAITTPEEAAVLERLSALPAEWPSDELRTALLSAAHAAAFARAAAETLLVARLAVAEAFRVQDLAAVTVAASMVTTAEWVVAALPALSPVHIDGACDLAIAELAAAVAAIPAVPALSVELEAAAWRTWQLRSHPQAVGPIELPAERVLTERLHAWRQQATRHAATVADQSGPGFAADTLDQLERLAGLLPTVQSIAADGTVVAAMVEAANAQREAAGLTWNAQPKDVPYSSQVDSPELRALARFRAQRREAVPAC